MTPDQTWNRAKHLFADALERPPSERSEHVARECRGDAELQARVEAMLDAHSRMGEFLRPPETPELVEEVPETIGPYRVERELGRGGMGTVYLAEDPRLGREVAIKRLPDDCFRDPQRRALFEREARTAAHLNDPNIATIYELGEADERTYISMEYVPGCSLGDYLRERGALSVDEALEIAIQIAQGLKAAHHSGIIHRDLKPGNLMISEDGRVKILDFGLAKAVQSEPLEAGAVRSRTADGSTMGAGFLGTVGYSSPEQSSGGVADLRSDLFSFGVILHEMLSGEAPFRRDTPSGTLDAVLHEGPPASGNGRGVPKDLAALLERLLAKDPDQRYADTEEVLADLQALRARLRGGWRRWLWPLATAAALVVAVVVFLGRGDPFQKLRDQLLAEDPIDDTLPSLRELKERYGAEDPDIQRFEASLRTRGMDSFRRARGDLIGHLAAGRSQEAYALRDEIGRRQALWEQNGFSLSETGREDTAPFADAQRLVAEAEQQVEGLRSVEEFRALLQSAEPPFEEAHLLVEEHEEASFQGLDFQPVRQRAEQWRAALQSHLHEWVEAALDRDLPSDPQELGGTLAAMEAVRGCLDPVQDPGRIARLDARIQAQKNAIRMDELVRLALALDWEEGTELGRIHGEMVGLSEQAPATLEVGRLKELVDLLGQGASAFRLASSDRMERLMEEARPLVDGLDRLRGSPVMDAFRAMEEGADWLARWERVRAQEDLEVRQRDLTDLRTDIAALDLRYQDPAQAHVRQAEEEVERRRRDERVGQAVGEKLALIDQHCDLLEPVPARSALGALETLVAEGTAEDREALEDRRERVEGLERQLADWNRIERTVLPNFLHQLDEARRNGPGDLGAALQPYQALLWEAWNEEARLRGTALVRRPQDQEHRLRRALLLWRLGDSQGSLDALGDEEGPTAAARILRAQATFDLDPTDPARVEEALGLLQAADRDPDADLGELCYLRGSYRHVLARLKELQGVEEAGLGPDGEVPSLFRAAYEDLERATRFGRSSADAWFQLASLASHRSDWDPECQRDPVQDALDFARQAAVAPFLEAEVVDALHGFERAAQGDSLRRFQSEVQRIQAESLVILEDWEAAIQACEACLEMTPGRPLPLYLRYRARLAWEAQREMTDHSQSDRHRTAARECAGAMVPGDEWYEEAQDVLSWPWPSAPSGRIP